VAEGDEGQGKGSSPGLILHSRWGRCI